MSVENLKASKLLWVLKLIVRLLDSGFEGTLMLDFSKGGNLSKKYRTQEIGYADED